MKCTHDKELVSLPSSVASTKPRMGFQRNYILKVCCNSSGKFNLLMHYFRYKNRCEEFEVLAALPSKTSLVGCGACVPAGLKCRRLNTKALRTSEFRELPV